MKRKHKVKDLYAVYDDRVSKLIHAAAEKDYKAIRKGFDIVGDHNFYAVLMMLAHYSATIATNAAQGKPLKRMWRTK